MTSLSSDANSRAKKCRKVKESTSQVKNTFQGKNLNSQMKYLLMNVAEYFEKEAKKSKSHPSVLERVSKQPVRQCAI